MDNNDKTRFSEMMMGLADNFGGTTSPEGMRMRFNALADYSIGQVTRAGDWLVKNRVETYPAMPTVKEFIETIKAQVSPVVSLGSRAEIQADIVLKKLRYEGRNAPIDFKDPITFKLMTERWRYSSWAESVKESELTWWKKDFVKAFDAYGESASAEVMAIGGQKNLKSLASGLLKRIA